MAEVRLIIPDEMVEEFRRLLGRDAKITDIARDAITFFNWGLQEKAKGRAVLSANEQGEERERITMSSLEKARQFARRAS